MQHARVHREQWARERFGALADTLFAALDRVDPLADALVATLAGRFDAGAALRAREAVGGATGGVWTTNGTGTFSPNATTLNATYLPSPADLTAKDLTLTLTTTGGSCGTGSDQMKITVNAAANVNAGADRAVCAASPAVVLAGQISGSATIGTWSGGAGAFAPNANSLNATYTPTAGEIAAGSVTLNGKSLLDLDPEARAGEGVFLAFQYPVEIPGVGNMTFLRTAVNAQRKARGEEELSAGDFLKIIREKAKTLKIDAEMLKRPVNVGFSGGEKKRNEILQMAMLEPKMCILDETDSGLDVDAMKLVADGVNALRDAGRSFLVITHYQRLLDHIRPDVVHIMAAGRIIKSGGPELALEVEANGYADILAEV